MLRGVVKALAVNVNTLYLYHIFYSNYCVVIDCGLLPNPEGGNVNFSKSTLGEIAYYDCQANFSLGGIATRRCLKNSTWSGIAPACFSKYSAKIRRNKL